MSGCNSPELKQKNGCRLAKKIPNQEWVQGF